MRQGLRLFSSGTELTLFRSLAIPILRDEMSDRQDMERNRSVCTTPGSPTGSQPQSRTGTQPRKEMVQLKPKATREIIENQIQEDGIEFLLAQFVDVNGAVKVKQVPAACFQDIVEDGAGFAGAAVWGMGQGPHSHDLMARADVDTYRRLPWKPNVAVLNTNLYVDGKPHPYCPRGNLLRMSELFAGEGYVLNCGFEPEHFLVVRNPDGSIKIWDPLGIDTLAKPCYDFKGMCQAMDYLQDVIRYGNELGLEIYQSDHEDANGQYEINFGWTNALHSSDRLTLFRMMTSQVAAKYGCIATYMAKPFKDKTGSGAHLHFHVADAKTGKNLFPLDPGSRDIKGLGLSKLAVHYVGGLLKHIRAITAVASPTVNCYRRIQSGEFVFFVHFGLHLDTRLCILWRQ